MKTLMAISKEMAENDSAVSLQSDVVIEKRKLYKQAEALYKNEFAKQTMLIKATNPSWRSPDIKSMAMTETYDKQLEMITAESLYLSERGKLDKLRAEKETLLEESYNLRTEMKKFQA